MEPNSALSERLHNALVSMVQMDVHLESTAGGAYRALAVQQFDLAIIPERDSQKPAENLRIIQPGLAIVVTATSADDSHIELLKQHYDGVLRAEFIESDLPYVLAKIWWPNIRAGVVKRIGQTHGRSASDAQLEALCNTLESLDGLQQVILTSAGEIVICGSDDEVAARRVAQQIRRSWDDGPRTAQIKILPTAGKPEAVMWYTIPTTSYLLTVAAQPDAPLYRVRHQAKQLAMLLESEEVFLDIMERDFNVSEDPYVDVDSVGRSYHLVWWPIDPMPQFIRQLVVRYVHHIAQVNACAVHKLDVTANGIHLFVTCPPRRMSCWAADLFKRGIQERFQQRFGYSIELWQKGYYAADNEHPPAEAELEFVLGPVASTLLG